MKERFLRSFAIAISCLLVAASARAQSVPASDAENTQTWLVELSNPPAVEGTSAGALKSEKAAFRAAAAQAGIAMSERYAFGTLWNGVSVKADASQVPAIARLPGVKNVWRSAALSVPPTTPGDPELVTALSMTGADIVQSELGFTGAGVKVGVIDTGIDYLHPDLGEGFGSGYRVAYGYDFVGDAYDEGTNPTRVPDADPMDCAGHGTHVAGIIGAHAKAAGGVTGVAPAVTFGAYRVFGCAGSTSADVMIAAMEMAYADGMQVINMSIGSAFQWPQYPTAAVASNLVKHGVVVVVSMGNDGTAGLFAGSAPGVGEKVIGVASFDNTFVNGLNAFSVSGISRLFGYLPATGAPAAPTSGSFPMARTGTTTSAADACSALPSGSLSGKVVLIRRGTCSFNIKANNAQVAGAAGVVLYNNTTGLLNPTVAGPPAITIPVVAVSNTDGALINAQIAAGATTFTWSDQLTSVPNPTGGLISSFSSYGLAPDLSLKPDIGAPGGFIRSTFPRALGSYANLSGTSMSSPHVAGAAALYLQANPKAHSWDVRDVLQNSAVPKPWFGNPGLGFLDNVNRQGAGMLRIDSAILAAVRAKPGKLSLGESQNGPVTQTITLTNEGSSDVTFAVSNTDALANGPNTFTPSFAISSSTVAPSATTVAVPAGGSASVTVSISPDPGLPANSLYGGYVVFTATDGSQTIRVPYAGFKGDFQSIQVLKPTANGFPWLAKLAGGSFTKQAAGATFNVAAGEIPYFLAHLDQQPRTFRIQIFDADGRDWHWAARDDYDPRNSTATGFYAWTFDGTTTTGAKGQKAFAVPAGTYTAQIQVLKALGNPDNPADWETWTSPSFSIVR
ncbi:MAG: S8 family serine peptidase [Myxococcales bacterium]